MSEKTRTRQRGTSIPTNVAAEGRIGRDVEEKSDYLTYIIIDSPPYAVKKQEISRPITIFNYLRPKRPVIRYSPANRCVCSMLQTRTRRPSGSRGGYDGLCVTHLCPVVGVGFGVVVDARGITAHGFTTWEWRAWVRCVSVTCAQRMWAFS